jgi:hypothetical protein
MSLEEMRAAIAAYNGELPTIVESEKYEDSEQFVGKINGERHEALSPIALALVRVLGDEPKSCCGNCCDSNCGCF